MGGGGILYNPDEPDSLRKALETMIGDEELRSRCGKEGRDAAESYFNSDRMGRETMKFYRRLSGVGGPVEPVT